MAEKKLGFDTGFFIKILLGNKKAVEIWKAIKDRKALGYVSSLSLFEIKRLMLKGSIDKKSSEILLNDVNTSCQILWIDNKEIIESSAQISYNYNIPAIDSLIIPSFIAADVKRIYTTDTDFQKYRKKDVSITVLK
jgi:predicted nucleic acid-binding protein